MRDALLDATARLVAEHGISSVTMTQVAEATGIGRATLYKYFPDVESIVHAWHERRIGGHLHQLRAVAGGDGDITRRLSKVLSTYAMIDFSHHGGDLAPVLHQGGHAVHAQRHLLELVRELMVEGVDAGIVRG
ncbi:TetR/AcrR family transcriptional regulator, partial [Nocardia bovistercoris]